MSTQLVIQHDLSQLSAEQLEQYKRDVSAFVGLDPSLNGLDTIFMDNEHGPGRSLVLYARRGTAEILREINKIEVLSLTSTEVRGSIVFTATGKNKDGRQEIATGSKSLLNLNGKALDNAIMTASTRALRRLTMQFTKLGILDESEIDAVQGSTANPAAGAALTGSAVVMPPVPTVPANNAPGRDITVEKPVSTVEKVLIPAAPVVIPMTQEQFEVSQQALRNEAQRQLNAEVDAITDKIRGPAPVTTTESITSVEITSDMKPDKPKRAPRKPRNTVTMDGPEAEVVSNSPATPPVTTVATSPAPPTAPESVPVSVPAQVNPAVPPQANPASTDFPGKPNPEQMSDYRKRVSVYTAELVSSETMNPVQKMRSFITRTSGTAPQFMTTDQWEEMLGWFEAFVAKNQMKGLVKYINDSLGTK